MIVPRTSREEILAKLRAKIEREVPIFIASAGSGLVAQLLESAGADCVNTFAGARLRANGMGTMSMLWPILDPNKQTLDYTREDILPAMKGDAFVCACLNANDPLMDMHTVLQRCKGHGRDVRVEHRAVDQLRRQGQQPLSRCMTKSGITFHNEDRDARARHARWTWCRSRLAFDEEDSLARWSEGATARRVLLPRGHDQGRVERLRLGRDDRGDGAAHRGRQPDGPASSSPTSS